MEVRLRFPREFERLASSGLFYSVSVLACHAPAAPAAWRRTAGRAVGGGAARACRGRRTGLAARPPSALTSSGRSGRDWPSGSSPIAIGPIATRSS